LRETLPILQANGLAQTANFVDGFGWDRSLVGVGVGWLRNVVAFPYWEVWTVPEVEDRFFDEVRGGGVFVSYPGKSSSHVGEGQNVRYEGLWPMDLLIARWIKARSHRNAYLAIGDGFRHIQNEYFPSTVSVSQDDVRKIQKMVFAAGEVTAADSSTETTSSAVVTTTVTTLTANVTTTETTSTVNVTTTETTTETANVTTTEPTGPPNTMVTLTMDTSRETTLSATVTTTGQIGVKHATTSRISKDIPTETPTSAASLSAAGIVGILFTSIPVALCAGEFVYGL